MLKVSIKLRYSLDKPPMERNEIVGNAFARTDRSALIKATRASDFPQNQSGDCFRGPREVSDFPREFVTKSDAKLRQKNEKSKLISKKRRKILTVSCKKNAKKMQKMTFFHNVSNKGSFNICIFEKFFVPL